MSTKGNQMLIECSTCNITALGEVIGEYSHQNPYDPMDGYKYSLVKCPQCFEPVLMRAELIFEINKVEWGLSEKIFPTNQFHVNPSIPQELRNALIESTKCYKAGSYTATAIMCRRTIEGFCLLKLKEENEKNLVKSLSKLKEKGIINEQLFEWANELRLTGNEAAHNINSSFTSIDAKDILDFTIAILDFSYSFKDKFEKFTERQRKQKDLN